MSPIPCKILQAWNQCDRRMIPFSCAKLLSLNSRLTSQNKYKKTKHFLMKKILLQDIDYIFDFYCSVSTLI